MDASWESTSPLCQPVKVAANRAAVIHLWSQFCMSASLRDDPNSGPSSTCVCSLKHTKNSLCALLYIHSSWPLPRAWQPQMSVCLTQLSSVCQKLSFLFQDSLQMTQFLEFSFIPSRCLKWIKDERCFRG